MRPLRLGVLAIAAMGAVLAAPLLGAPQFPPLTGRVVDDAGLLSPDQRHQLTGWLTQFETATKRQVVVATVKSLQGYAIEDYGYQLGRFWGIGEKDKNTGAILLVAPSERKVRIEVGYGLEGELTDAICSTIVNQDILPAFRQGKYGDGILAGTAAILEVLGWSGASAAIPPSQPREAEGAWGFIPMLLFLVMIWIVFWRLFRHGGGPRGGAMAMLGYGLGAMSGSSMRFGGGGFGAGGGGGFSGGGGSFGGGGASGSW